MYFRLARSEERAALAEFGEAYETYMHRVPGFIPRLSMLLGHPADGVR
jgi:protein-S-isoprenylcysteine O-methyltransferase Ste14